MHVLGLQKDWQIDGARFFDVDAYGQTMVIVRGHSGMGGSNILTKVKFSRLSLEINLSFFC